jgi:ribosomal protein S18 acetylase RimI-like enzyme
MNTAANSTLTPNPRFERTAEKRSLLGTPSATPPGGLSSFTLAVVAAPIGVLYDLYVKPGARQSGVGAALLLAAEQFAKEHGFVRMDLTTAKTNSSAQSRYESLGWKRDEMFYAYSKDL